MAVCRPKFILVSVLNLSSFKCTTTYDLSSNLIRVMTRSELTVASINLALAEPWLPVPLLVVFEF